LRDSEKTIVTRGGVVAGDLVDKSGGHAGGANHSTRRTGEKTRGGGKKGSSHEGFLKNGPSTLERKISEKNRVKKNQAKKKKKRL